MVQGQSNKFLCDYTTEHERKTRKMSEAIQNTNPVVEEIEVRSDIEAGWQLERRKKLLADRDELIAFYEAQIEAVKEDADYKLGFIERALFAYFKTKKHTKTQTQEYVKLPLGKLMLKKQNPEFKRDDAKVIEWLKENGAPEFVKVEEKLDWANLKKATTIVGNAIVNTDGEIIPGVEVIEREDKFCIE